MADSYDIATGLLGGLNKGIMSYYDSKKSREDRAAEMAAKGLIQGEDDKWVKDPAELAREKAKNMRESTLKLIDLGIMPKPEDFDAEGNINLATLQSSGGFGNKALDKQKKELEIRKLNQDLSQGSFTPGEKATDAEFAKEYNRYVNEGGFAATDSGLKKLEEAAGEIKSKKLTGGFSGFLPKIAQDYVNPELGAVRDKIQSAIQSSLKTVLDSQFAAREAEAVMERSFNPRLPPEENFKRVMAEAEKIKQKAQATEQTARYFEANKGSLRGFKGTGMLNSSNVAIQPPPSGHVSPKSAGGPMGLIQPQADAEALSREDQVAIDFAKRNRGNPDAEAILKLHGIK